MPRIITALSEISANYDAMFVDLWGCVHNGITAFDEAVAALRAYRAGGGFVVLVTNSPKPRAGVAAQLPDFGVPSDCYDTIATSGDSARAAMFTGAVGNKVFFMGEWERDAGFFEPMQVIDTPVEITRVPVAEAEGIVCCGPFDPMADPDTWRADLMMAKQMGAKLLCANPDIIVDRGEAREWCAGAVARMYTEMGGESLYFGKPHPPIYDLARRRMLAEGRDIPNARILAIGDGIHTDIRGALGEDIDSLFITGGLAREETGTLTQPDPVKLAQFVADEQISPSFAIGYLR
ncbi:TIGR01459 family HAD-type hydrolase [Aliiroseovarius crassostreae]|uniref:TIGR01459 family HAD-type hydrolase n=1 Tax=Aliiroseovarius crassostreae TaxID=154981 RepID=UPI002204607D|nr:TIGR01459 family HAD-type hydrolase [Aliiroseovarius crassostreae]UWQ08502.1 TIGR01459 family HAD-type hydrolase [Aliiroseovarius crassostreae]UWQ11603.1 TIGR01459 family HAD-type hydrolase [Aliiroseovarius crassostreae]